MRSSVGLSGLVLPLPSPDMPHTNGVWKIGHSSVAMSIKSCKLKLNGTFSRAARERALCRYFLMCCCFTNKPRNVFLVS